ncbi:MAG: hypothetical protein ACKPKO_27245, partial [Candidatus Fonsibacter sp.]
MYYSTQLFLYLCILSEDGTGGDACLRRASICIPDSTFNPFGPKYFVVVSLDQSPQGVRIRLPKGYRDKATVGLNNT